MPDGGLPVEAILQRGVDRLRSFGVADSRRQALSIWSELSGQPAAISLASKTGTDRSLLARFEAAIERRGRGEPLPYVTGAAGFRHLTVRSDGRALIPRPETEGLVDLLLQRVRSGVVVDVGTGTGCLALSLAQEGSFSLVIAADRSREALELARENVSELRSKTPIWLMQGDLCSFLQRSTVDAIVSNPPYLTVAEHAALDASVRDWEPAQALVGGLAGLEVTKRLLEQARDVLRPGGWIATEIDCSRAEAAVQMTAGQGWDVVSIHKDLFDRERYLLAQRSDAR